MPESFVAYKSSSLPSSLVYLSDVERYSACISLINLCGIWFARNRAHNLSLQTLSYAFSMSMKPSARGAFFFFASSMTAFMIKILSSTDLPAQKPACCSGSTPRASTTSVSLRLRILAKIFPITLVIAIPRKLQGSYLFPPL